MVNLLTHFQRNEAVQLLDIDPKTIVSTLSPSMVIKIMTELGAERYEETDEYIVFPTICHNPYSTPMSMKLYYYLNTKLFHCYTECSETMNIFKLIQKIKEVNNEKVSFQDILFFITGFYEGTNFTEIDQVYSPIIAKFQKQIPLNSLQIYNTNILSCFDGYHMTSEWLKEGITPSVHRYFNIGFSVGRNCITIPHFNIDLRLVGIRGRQLDFKDHSGIAKYAPLTIEGKLYSHPLSLNLYGIGENKEGITNNKKVIIFEGEIRPYLSFR